MIKEVDVVIIGAGISGLNAAFVIKKKDPKLNVVVLEAKDRVGGRTLSVPLKSATGTDTWDLGGQWVGRCQPHIMALIKELGLETHQQYISGIKFMQLGSNKISSYASTLPSLSPLALIDLHRFTNQVERMVNEIDVTDPWKCDKAPVWDTVTVDNYLQSHMWTKGAKEAVEASCRGIFGAETTQISLLFYIMYIKAAGGVKNLVEASDNAGQEYRIKEGAQSVSFRLLERIGKECVHLNQIVSSVMQYGLVDWSKLVSSPDMSSLLRFTIFDPNIRLPDPDTIHVICEYHSDSWPACPPTYFGQFMKCSDESSAIVKTTAGLEIKCKQVIIATPPCQTVIMVSTPRLVEKVRSRSRLAVCAKMNFNPRLPSYKKELYSRMPVSSIIKIIVTYKQAFWRNAGQSGEVITNGGISSVEKCDTGPLCMVFDATSAQNSPALVSFIGASQATQWSQQSEEARRSAVLNSLASFFGPDVHSYLDYREKDWSAEPFSEGGPVHTVGPGAMQNFCDGLRKPFGRIHFAGTESAVSFCGFMSGAVDAGTRAAREVLYKISPGCVMPSELLGTAYGQPVVVPRENPKKRHFMRWTVGIGTVIVVAIIVKRCCFRDT